MKETDIDSHRHRKTDRDSERVGETERAREKELEILRDIKNHK